MESSDSGGWVARVCWSWRQAEQSTSKQGHDALMDPRVKSTMEQAASTAWNEVSRGGGGGGGGGYSSTAPRLAFLCLQLFHQRDRRGSGAMFPGRGQPERFTLCVCVSHCVCVCFILCFTLCLCVSVCLCVCVCMFPGRGQP